MLKDQTKLSLPNPDEIFMGIGDQFPLPPFRVVARQSGPVSSAGGTRGRLDGTIDLEWKGQVQRFAVEYKTPGTPRQIESALQQVRQFIGAATQNLKPLIVAPYLRPGILDRLVDEGVSGMDLSGNYAVVVPGRWLVIRSGYKNKYPSNAPIKNVYRGKSSLVARALMLRGEFGSVTAIANELAPFGSISLPTVSKVLKSLEEDLIIERNETIRVAQPSRLLENLVSNYEGPVVRNRMLGKVSLDPQTVARINANASSAEIAYAADSPSQYTVLPSSDQVTAIYTDSIPKLMAGIPVDWTSRFPDIELKETSSLSVYYGRRLLTGGLYWTSPLQVYLELARGQKREKQAAEQIARNLLVFRFR